MPSSVIDPLVCCRLIDNMPVLHSAGHLLDVAMGIQRPELKASKGAHFEGNSNVEYKGALTPEERIELKIKLQDTIDSLIKNDGDITGLFERGFRTVDYGGDHGLGGCGGTHASRFSEIGKVSIEKISKVKDNIKVKYSVV
jgi:Ser-tRNA(Ala) deacylase AlaX